MILVYSYCGVVASCVLIATISNIIMFLLLLDATLTLPGIAGIVLTIGMAVDANVLIFERLRDEIKECGDAKLSYMKVRSILDAGFRRASSAIVDSNFTTIIAGLVLFFVGDGPLRGFGVTLCVGIVSSFLMSVLLSRMIMVGLIKAKIPVLAQL